jgi:Na+/proline symporter
MNLLIILVSIVIYNVLFLLVLWFFRTRSEAEPNESMVLGALWPIVLPALLVCLTLKIIKRSTP